MANEHFLVQVDHGRFLVEFDGASARVTDTPSMAAQLSYSVANAACQRLRKRGFRQSVVCDITGNPMTYEAIREVADALHSNQASLPTTQAELDAIPSREQQRLCNQSPAFLARFNELESHPRAPKKVSR
jgi:hypothetical protein